MPIAAARMVKKQVLEPSSQWLSRLPDTVSHAIDDSLDATKRTLERARSTAEELSDQAVHTIKRYPVQVVAVTFGLAVGAGLLIGFLVGRKRKPTFLERAGARASSLLA